MDRIDISSIPDGWFRKVSAAVRSEIREMLEERCDDHIETEAHLAVIAAALDLAVCGAEMLVEHVGEETAEGFCEAVERSMWSIAGSGSVKLAGVFGSLDSLGVEFVPPKGGKRMRLDEMPRSVQEKVAEGIGMSVEELASSGATFETMVIDSATGEEVDLAEALERGAKIGSVLATPMGVNSDDEGEGDGPREPQADAIESMLDMFGGAS